MRSLAVILVSLSAVTLAADTPAPSPSPASETAARASTAGKRKQEAEKATPAPAERTAPAPAGQAPATPKPKAAPKGAKKPGHVYTNQDLPAEPPPVAAASPGTGGGRGSISEVGPHASEIPVPEATPAPPEEETEPYWSQRADQARQAIGQAEYRVSELEQRIGELRDDRSPTNVMDPNREQTRRAQIAEAQAELEAARMALEAARRSLVDLEEEARRKRIPPGWLRER